MREYPCDICGIMTQEKDLNDVVPEYRSPEIRKICGDCLDTLTKVFTTVQQAIAPIRESWIRRTLARVKAALRD